MIKPAIQRILDKARERKQQKLAAAAANPKTASKAGDSASSASVPGKPAAGNPSRRPPQFRREVRVGLGVLTVLLGTFGFVAWQRFAAGDDSQVVAQRPTPPSPRSTPAEDFDHDGHQHARDQQTTSPKSQPSLPKLPSRDDRVQPAAWAQAFDQPSTPPTSVDPPQPATPRNRYAMDESQDVPETSTVTIRTQVTPVDASSQAGVSPQFGASQAADSAALPASFAAGRETPDSRYGSTQFEPRQNSDYETAGNRFTATVTDPDAPADPRGRFASTSTSDMPGTADASAREHAGAGRYSFSTDADTALPDQTAAGSAGQPAGGQLPRYSSPSPYEMPAAAGNRERVVNQAQDFSEPAARFSLPATTVMADAPSREVQSPRPAADDSGLRPLNVAEESTPLVTSGQAIRATHTPESNHGMPSGQQDIRRVADESTQRQPMDFSSPDSYSVGGGSRTTADPRSSLPAGSNQNAGFTAAQPGMPRQHPMANTQQSVYGNPPSRGGEPAYGGTQDYIRTPDRGTPMVAQSQPNVRSNSPGVSDFARPENLNAGAGGFRERGAPARQPGQDEGYTVGPNENYWSISQKLYGNGSYFKALAEHNRDRIPRADQLQVGDVISAPALEQLEVDFPGLCPKRGRPSLATTGQSRTIAASRTTSGSGQRTYTVQDGDTLFDIARYELGRASRWVEIYELNRDTLGTDFNFVRPGTQLVLPSVDQGRQPDPVTSRPQHGFRR